MTDRLKGVTVAFDEDIREDDAESIINAILALKHVQHVTTLLTGVDDWINRQRIRHELAEKLLEVVREK